jgi:hypothetical protein
MRLLLLTFLTLFPSCALTHEFHLTAEHEGVAAAYTARMK